MEPLFDLCCNTDIPQIYRSLTIEQVLQVIGCKVWNDWSPGHDEQGLSENFDEVTADYLKENGIDVVERYHTLSDDAQYIVKRIQ